MFASKRANVMKMELPMDVRDGSMRCPGTDYREIPRRLLNWRCRDMKKGRMKGKMAKWFRRGFTFVIVTDPTFGGVNLRPAGSRGPGC